LAVRGRQGGGFVRFANGAVKFAEEVFKLAGGGVGVFLKLLKEECTSVQVGRGDGNVVLDKGFEAAQTAAVVF
jgi:hypothetical protein